MSNKDNTKSNILYIGFPKTGTTWVQMALCEHPQINYLHKSRFFVLEGLYEKGADFYNSLFPTDKTVKVEGDEMLITDRFQDPHKTMMLIKKMLPKAKIIISVRNQIDLLESAYIHHIIRSKHITSYNRFLCERSSGLLYLKMANYYELIQKYVDLFGLENILVQVLESAKKDPASYLKRIYNFLEVDHTFQPLVTLKKVNESPSKMSTILILLFNKFFTGLRSIKRVGIKLLPSYQSLKEDYHENKNIPLWEKPEYSSIGIKRRINDMDSILAIEYGRLNALSNRLLYRPILSYIDNMFLSNLSKSLKIFLLSDAEKKRIKEEYHESNKKLSSLIGINLEELWNC